MTEEEWRQSDDAHKMLMWFHANWQGEPVELRRIRERYWLACCRRIWKLILHKDSRRSLKILERYLNGTATIEEFDAAEWQAEGAMYFIQYQMGLQKIARWVKEIGSIPPDELRSLVRPTHRGEELSPDEILWQAARFAHVSFRNEEYYAWSHFYRYKPFLSAPLVREVIGNPFHPMIMDPTWLTVDVTMLANAIYEENAFNRMPFLGDALEEAGCTDAEMLKHCREPGDHVRGCWVIAGLIGKT